VLIAPMIITILQGQTYVSVLI